MSKMTGFNLIEVLVVVLILGILASLSIPSYTRYVARSYRVLILNELAEMKVFQERVLSQENEYIADLSDYFSVTNNTCPAKSLPSEKGRYCLSVIIGNNLMDYTLVAEAIGKQLKLDSGCAIISLTSTGLKLAENSLGVETSKACWY